MVNVLFYTWHHKLFTSSSVPCSLTLMEGVIWKSESLPLLDPTQNLLNLSWHLEVLNTKLCSVAGKCLDHGPVTKFPMML